MSTETGKVAKNSVLYSIASILTKASGLLLMPIYSNVKYLTEEEYGEYNLLIQFAYAALFFVNLALNHSVLRFYSDFKNDKEKCKRFFGSILTFVTFVGMGVVALFVLFRRPLTDVLFTGIKFFPGVILALITLVFNAIYAMYQSVLQTMQQGKKYSANNILFVATHSALNIVFIVGFRNMYIDSFHLGGVNGMMISVTISYFLFAMYGIIDLFKRGLMKVIIDREMLEMALKYSVPLLPHTAANNIAVYIPKFFLNKVSKAYTAIYSVSSQFSSIIDVVQISINTALRPWFNENMKRGEEGKKDIINFTMIAFKLSVIVCLGVALFSQELVLFIASSETYYEAWKVVPVLACTHAVKCIYYNYTLAIMYDLRSSKYLFLCSISGTVVNFILTWLLVVIVGLGPFGAAVSFLISRSVSASLIIAVCKRYDIIRFPLRQMVSCVILSAVFSVIGIVPVNYYATNFVLFGEQIEFFSGWFFVNMLFKVIVFVCGCFCVIGKQRKEIIGFVKTYVLKTKD